MVLIMSLFASFLKDLEDILADVKPSESRRYPLITLRDRQSIANKVMDLANISAGALIFTNYTFDTRYSFLLLIIGTIILIALYSFAIIFMRRKI